MARRDRTVPATPEGASETLPVDVLPASNGEFVPPAPIGTPEADHGPSRGRDRALPAPVRHEST